MSFNPIYQYCKCGYHFKPTLFMKVIMLWRGKYIKTCPYCNRRLELRLYSFVVCKKRNDFVNKKIWEKG